MTVETYGAFVLFVIVMTGTPGIGNLTMMAIGQATGFRSALPFLAGATAGMLLLNTAVGLGLGGLFMASPGAARVVKALGLGYILYLAWRLLRMRPAGGGEARRFTFAEGVLVHPLNPKSWAMSVVGFSQLADPSAGLAAQLAVFVPTFFRLSGVVSQPVGLGRGRAHAHAAHRPGIRLRQRGAGGRHGGGHGHGPVRLVGC